MTSSSLAFRLVLISSLWIFAALAGGSLLITRLFTGYVERNLDSRLDVLVEALVAASEVEFGQLNLTRMAGEPRFEVPYSGWYWQISGPDGVALRSRSLWDSTLQSRDGSGEEPAYYDAKGPQERELRAVQRLIRFAGADKPFVYVVTADRAEIAADIENFNRALGWSLGVLGSGLIAAVLLQVRVGLLPLRRIGDSLAAIRSGESEKLTGKFPEEVMPLADELNQLLDHNAEVVRRARTHVGNLAHALKTPITVLANEADANPGPFAETVRRQSTMLRRLVDHHLSRARTAASINVLGARTELRPVVEALCRTLEKIHAGRGVTVTHEIVGELAFRGERHDFEDLLGNLVDNACKWAAGQVFVRATLADGRVEITVDDDGPGLKPEQRSEVFERGARLDEDTPGTGLGLSIVRDVAGMYGGTVELEESPLGGVRAVLTLPGLELKPAAHNHARG